MRLNIDGSFDIKKRTLTKPLVEFHSFNIIFFVQINVEFYLCEVTNKDGIYFSGLFVVRIMEDKYICYKSLSEVVC